MYTNYESPVPAAHDDNVSERRRRRRTCVCVCVRAYTADAERARGSRRRRRRDMNETREFDRPIRNGPGQRVWEVGENEKRVISGVHIRGRRFRVRTTLRSQKKKKGKCIRLTNGNSNNTLTFGCTESCGVPILSSRTSCTLSREMSAECVFLSNIGKSKTLFTLLHQRFSTFLVARTANFVKKPLRPTKLIYK